MAKITVQLGDVDAENLIERYDDGNLQTGAFVKSTVEDSESAISDYVIDTCDSNYKKFTADTLVHWTTTSNADLIRLKKILEEANDCASIVIEGSVVHPLFLNTLADIVKGRGIPINAIPMEWAKRYFTQMISEKNPLFEYKIDLLGKIVGASTDETLSIKMLEKLIIDAKSESENKNPFKNIFGLKTSEESQKIAELENDVATFNKILKHYREETLYTRSSVIIDDVPFAVSVFADPSCQFVSVEFKNSYGLRFEFSTLKTESKLPATFENNGLGLTSDRIFFTLAAIAEHYKRIDSKISPQAEAFVNTLTTQL